MIFRLFTVVLFAVLPLIGKASAAEMILKVDISPEEKSILARGWTQQEIEQESAALLAYPEKPEKVSENAEYWKKRFFGSGVTVFSKCFRNYTEKYMKKFLSPEGILTGETADIMYKKCWDYGKDLNKIYCMQYLIKENMPEYRCRKIIDFLCDAIDNSFEKVEFGNFEYKSIEKEYCFWLAMNQVVNIGYNLDDAEADTNTIRLIRALSWFDETAYSMNTQTKKSCCNLL